jgi:hypothetical protein
MPLPVVTPPLTISNSWDRVSGFHLGSFYCLTNCTSARSSIERKLAVMAVAEGAAKSMAIREVLQWRNRSRDEDHLSFGQILTRDYLPYLPVQGKGEAG